MATVQVVYNFCAMPEYMERLRLEAQSVLNESGGVWTVEAINNLRRLDSFIKESQRLNASSFCKPLFNHETGYDAGLLTSTCCQ